MDETKGVNEGEIKKLRARVVFSIRHPSNLSDIRKELYYFVNLVGEKTAKFRTQFHYR